MKAYGKRVEELLLKISSKGAGCALFVNMEPVMDSNITYLSGFSGMLSGALLVSEKEVKLFTSVLDHDRASEEAAADEIVSCEGPDFFKDIRRSCAKYKKIGVVKSKFTLEMAEKAGLSPSRLLDAGSILERARSVKDESEIEAMKKCAGIMNKGISFLGDFLRSGLKEKEVAMELNNLLEAAGSERSPFETIVASGKRSSFVHPDPPASANRLKRGIGLVDFGSVFNGYVNDVTVPFILGKERKKEAEIAGTVMGVWDDVAREIKAGVRIKDLYDIFKKGIEGSGFKVKHSLGHGVGLDTHEYPSLGGTSKRLEKDMVLSVEPGAYVKGVGGLRIENVVHVRRGGCKVLTKSKLLRL